jgi:23S rRNA pseudouridine1911/1915/1917 synthase
MNKKADSDNEEILDDEVDLDSGALETQLEQEFCVDESSAGQRLDQFLTEKLEEVSRARVQMLIEQNCVQVCGADGSSRGAKPSMKLRVGEIVRVRGEVTVEPLRAEPEDIPLDIVYEDEFLAVINKPAGMMVHAGAGATGSARNRGTLVNALLYHMAQLSVGGGPLRPGIVHRLDKQTSGLIVIAKDDVTHRRLGEMFAERRVHKTYLALVHGVVKQEQGTINAAISRDIQRRTRMTTRGMGGRTAVSHYKVQQRLQSRYGQFTLLAVKIETGRTHQIRVHLSSIGYPVVGDTLYGAAGRILPRISAPATRSQREAAQREAISLDRNFLHAARLQFTHPRTGRELLLEAPLPADLCGWLQRLELDMQKNGPVLPRW